MKIKTKMTNETKKQFEEIRKEEISNAIKRGKAYAKKQRLLKNKSQKDN